MKKVCFFVPNDHKEKVKEAMFQAGAGKIGAYDCCGWEVEGTGQFRPLEGSDPFVGSHGKIETISEFKVEMVCSDSLVHDVILAMKTAHPYEEPAYEVYEILDLSLKEI